MKISSWYNNGSLDAFYRFCRQNRRKTVVVKLKEETELVKGVLYKNNTPDRHLQGDGLYVFLNPSRVHPAYYCLEDIESIHECQEISNAWSSTGTAPASYNYEPMLL